MAPTFSPGIPVSKGDLVRFNAYSSASVTMNLTLSIQDLKLGNIYPFQLVSAPTTRAGTSVTKTIDADGVIVSGAVAQSIGTVPAQPGNIYVVAYVERGGFPIAAILGGYFWNGQRPGYPGIFKGPLEGPGRLYVVTGTNPAANTETSDAVPANARWRLIAWSVVLVTDANAANRNTSLIIDDGTAVNRRQILADTTNHTASLTRTHLFQRGNGAASQASFTQTDTQTVLVHNGIPDNMYLEAAASLRTVTAGIQVGDDYAAPLITVEEWIST